MKHDPVLGVPQAATVIRIGAVVNGPGELRLRDPEVQTGGFARGRPSCVCHTRVVCTVIPAPRTPSHAGRLSSWPLLAIR